MELFWNLAVSALVIALGACLVLRWAAACGAPIPHLSAPAHPLEGAGVQTGRRTLVRVFGAALGIRLAVFLLALLLGALLGELGNRTPLELWERWDAHHYVHLVELGYNGYIEDGQHLFLVFFPLYVWVVRLVNLVVGNTLLAGMLVSWLCYAGGCVYLYRLAALDYGPSVARRSVWYLSIFPYAFFFGGVMTEGLFLLTTCAALWQIRNHRWLSAGVWGALAALTRMHGLLLIGVTGAELCRAEQIFAPDGRSVGQRLWALVRRLPALLLPAVGTLGYLLVNLWVDGDPFAFTVHQEHWSQGFLWISQTLAYLVQNALSYPNEVIRWELWVPEVLLFPLFFALLVWAARRVRSTYTLYAYVTLVLDYSLSWLLSAGRYLSCASPFFLFAALLTEGKPRTTAALSGGMIVCFVLLLWRFLAGGQIM